MQKNETIANTCLSLCGDHLGCGISIIVPIAAAYPHLTDLHLRKPDITTNTDAKAYLATSQYQDPDVAHTHPNSTNCHPCSV